MAAVSSIIGLAGIALSAGGMMKSGQDAASAAAHNATMGNFKAGVIEENKAITRKEYDRMLDRLEGKSITAVASSGYDLSGSYLAVINDTLTQGELDKQKAIYNLEMEKINALAGSANALRVGAMAQETANTGAFATVLTEGNAWYDKYGGFSSDTTAPKSTASVGTTSDLPQSWQTVWGT